MGKKMGRPVKDTASRQYFAEQGISLEEISQKTGLRPSYVNGLLLGCDMMTRRAYGRLVTAFPDIKPLLDTPHGKPTKLDYLKRAIESLKANPTDKCVEWPFGRATYGYGTIRAGNATVAVHRLAFELYHGKPATLFVLHSCDNPACYNPAHLHEGTPRQNTTDWKTRGPSPHTITIRERRRNGNH